MTGAEQMHVPRAALRRISHHVMRGYRAIGGSTAIINLCVAIIAGCCLLFGWWAFLDPVVSLETERVVRVEPDDRIIDRGRRDHFMVTRHFCMSKPALAYVRREFVDGVIYQTPDGPPDQFRKGCQEQPRLVDVPDTLPPGEYTYRVILTFCNRLRCEEIRLHDIPLMIRGGWPPPASHAPAPMREPL